MYAESVAVEGPDTLATAWTNASSVERATQDWLKPHTGPIGRKPSLLLKLTVTEPAGERQCGGTPRRMAIRMTSKPPNSNPRLRCGRCRSILARKCGIHDLRKSDIDMR